MIELLTIFLGIVFLVPVIAIAMLCGYAVFIWIVRCIEWLTEEEPRYPSCSVDPREHHAFIWVNGVGMIGPHKVNI
jgi:hypothetical protein